MEDPSITKRLIDFGTDEHDYDEVQDLPDESNNNQPQQQPAIITNNNNNNNNNSTTAPQPTPIEEEDLPPELPPPKQKSVKNSKKSKSKSKIPRSPSLASTISAGSPLNNNNNSNIQLPLPLIPPETPPLPASYQNKSKHMNGSAAPTPTTPVNIFAASVGSPPTSPTPSIQLNNSNASNSAAAVMGGGVQISGGGGGGGVNVSANRSSLNMSSSTRRPQIQISPIAESPKNFQYLTLVVRKDENGYGMKVSGDNPVFVESVKPGGAAQVAGLVAGDMILRVNGQEVRSEKHPTVVSLIKASTIVELSVKRSQKMVRPTSVGITPSTPILSGRDRTASITGPQPVDSIKRREMETYKIQTLQKMLEQEKLNLERLKGDTNNPSYKLSEANIRKLREQLRQVGAEDAPNIKYQPTVNNNKNTAMLSPNQIHHLSVSGASAHHQQLQQHHQLHHAHHSQSSHQYQHQQATIPQPQPAQSSPAFMSLLPRSLSSLSLGGRKNKIDKDLIASALNNTTEFLHTSPTPPINMSQSLHQPHQLHRTSTQTHITSQLFHHQLQPQQQRFKDTPKSSNSSQKNKNIFAAQPRNLIQEDTPPPLPQRNRPLQADVSNNNLGTPTCAPISDLDHTNVATCQSPQLSKAASASSSSSPSSGNNSSSSSQKKRSKTKTKALSDPKMSTHLFLQMESASGAAGAAIADGSHEHFGGTTETDCVPPPLPPRQPGMLEESLKDIAARPAPNSIDTVLNYPLVSTCTAVHRDNMAAAFPLSHRPNIVQQLQQHQQHQQQQQQQMHGNASNGSGISSGCVGQSTAALGQTPHNVNNMSKHRRVVSSPENMHSRHPDRHAKTTSGSWELVEKDGEITPPGTPPPPYLTAHMNVSGADSDLHDLSTTSGGIFVESHHFTPLTSGSAASPTQTAATHSSRIQAAQSSTTQKEIISMEDEDASDQEGPFIDENGPFNSLQRLLEAENVAFLAVFLNYVLSNSEPAPLLFYLITGLYKEGSAKDMRKWAYEIHSTFLVPRAPLSWYRQDETLAREVDNVLQSEFDKVEILRKVFWKSRKRARDIICEQLREFQQKRTAGLGTIYGPTDGQLIEAKGDKQREQHIFEDTLLRKLQSLIEEYEKDLPLEDPKKLALCSAVSTVIHRIFVTRSYPNSIVDRVHHFVSREKSFKSRLMGKNRKMVVRGHPLVLRQYYEVTHCNHCQTIIWGVSPQGYHCTDCKLNIHRPCSKVLDENCPGPLPQAKRKEPHTDNKISKFMGKIRPRTSDAIAMEKRARHDEDADEFSNERLHSSSIVRQPSDRRPDAANISQRSNGNLSHNNSDLQSSFHGSGGEGISVGSSGDAVGSSATGGGGGGGAAGSAGCAGGIPTAGGSNAVGASPAMSAADANAQDADGKDARRERLHQHHQQNKSAPVLVNRSESYKERISQKRNRNSRRKTSDPSLTSRPNDEQPDVGLSNSKYPASSNSSLSSAGGSESPSTSMEQVGGPTGAVGVPSAHHHPHQHGPHHAHQHSHQESFHSSASSSFWGGSIGGPGGPTMGQLARQWNFESDEDDDLNEVDWGSNVAADVLAALTDAEKKRQEIINEIYQTERSHVRTLKLLERLFFVPLQESGVLSHDHLMLLFPPALLSLRELHSAFEQKLKQRRLEHNHVVNHIGDLLACMFDGQSGNDLCEFAAHFCARQQIALEALKEKRRKDEQLQKLLSKAESHKACRRLQLKDLLPTVLQRLTKYPLLFENLYKVTIRVVPENTSEAAAIQKAVDSSKKILVDVNQAVKTAEDAHKLQNIQKKLGKSELEEFKNLDLTQYRLIHDGSLEMKKNSSIQLHGLLFEDMIVLLTKQDEKYLLRNLHTARNTEVNKNPVSPIMKIDSEILIRQEAADKNSFFLIKTKTSQMLELRAPSSSECKTWFKHISDAAEQYKPRSKNANHEPVDDPAIATLPHSNTRESLELTPERPSPLAATATVSTTPLAPMMPIATVSMTHAAHAYNPNHMDGSNVQMRSGQRESTPVPPSEGGLSAAAYHKQRLSHNELSSPGGGGGSSVNRTMSTRSCDSNPHYANNESTLNGVTLRHTQSARQANAENDSASAGGPSKRDSASIVYSNNSNNTRTLMQSSPPLVEPTAIQISISPAHTAEPVLTPAERLRRLDASIRDGLLEKQKIICDMFRLPVEHFHEIVDIAGMPEAPKDSADIALAAYAQVQSLTEVLNEYMHAATPEQELLPAISSAVCDQCHEKQQQRLPTDPASSPTISSSASSTTTVHKNDDQTPPPLPPPNKQSAQGQTLTQAQQQTPTSSVTKIQTHALDEADIHEDDDGYCEIDELRLPALPNLITTKATPQPQMPTSGGNFKTPQLPPSPSSPQAAPAQPASPPSPPELVKRQSTISAESIPEESADEVTAEAMDESPAPKEKDAIVSTSEQTEAKPEAKDKAPKADQDKSNIKVKENEVDEDAKTAKLEEPTEKEDTTAHKEDDEPETTSAATATEPNVDSQADAKESDKDHNDGDGKKAPEAKGIDSDNLVNTIIQNSMEALDTLNQLTKNVPMVDNMTQTMPTSLTLTTHTPWTNTNGSLHHPPCGQDRIQHANTMEPSVPCHALNSIVSALNSQISLLLPKINERDMERERLRKENQHLRELLNAMHERQRVEAKLETPTDIRSILSGAIDADDDMDGYSTNSTTPTPTPPANSDDTAAIANDIAETQKAKE